MVSVIERVFIGCSRRPALACVVASSLFLCGAAAAADGGEGWHQLDRATWPGDIVQWADRIASTDPAAAQAQELRRRAIAVLSLLRNQDIRLFRNAFLAELGSAERNADLRRAALGDGDAAYRVALLYKGGEVPQDRHRYVGWLQLAARLGHEQAAYELALYYRREGQLTKASAYEALAVSLGYQPPLALDHLRK